MNIYLPKSYTDRMGNRRELFNCGVCAKCGRQYSWRVSYLRQFSKPDTEEEYNQTRAMNLFLEYKSKGVGHCCADKEHRAFIAKSVGTVQYE